MSERRPFVEDVPELWWERDEHGWSVLHDANGVLRVDVGDDDGIVVEAAGSASVALLRAGIRIGLERAKKYGRKTPKQVKRYRSKLMLQRRWWRAAKRALAKKMVQYEACMRAQRLTACIVCGAPCGLPVCLNCNVAMREVDNGE